VRIAAARRLARAKERESNARRDNAHKVSRALIERYDRTGPRSGHVAGCGMTTLTTNPRPWALDGTGPIAASAQPRAAALTGPGRGRSTPPHCHPDGRA
jgi:hypothetical protein